MSVALEEGSRALAWRVGWLRAGEPQEALCCTPVLAWGLRVERGAPAQPLISHVVFCSFQSMGICFIGKRNFENFILEVSVL